MRTRVTLRRPGGATTDVVVTTEAGATVGDVAETIARAEGIDAGERQTLLLTVPGAETGRALPRAAGLGEAGLRAGSTIALVPSSDRYAEPGTAPHLAEARLQVLSGPQAGLEVDLPRGVATIGRGEGCTVRLSDRMVSKVHARLVVGDTVEIVDSGSSNGLMVGGDRVDRLVLGSSDQVLLGDSLVQVQRLRAADPDGVEGASVPFNRSPRVVPVFEEREVEAPTPPEPAKPGRFPIVALIAPLILGATLYAFTRSPLSLVFVALSPLLMIGTYLDKRWSDRSRLRTEKADFADGLARLEERLTELRTEEQRLRLAEAPSTAEVVAAARSLDPLLWSVRPEHTSFLQLRVGTGAAPSRTTLAMPPRGKAVAELWEQLEDVQNRYADTPDVPLLVQWREVGAVGVAGTGEAGVEVARSLVAQALCLHSPAELVLTGIVPPSAAAGWDWLKWMPHVASPHSPLPGPHLASAPAGATDLLRRLEELVAARTAARTREPVPAVLLVVTDGAPADRGRLVRLAEEGPAAGVHVLWHAPTVEALPAACRAFLSVDGPEARVGLVRDGAWQPVTCERLDAWTATALARHLTAVADAGAPEVDESDLPRSVGYLELAGTELAHDATAVLDRWRETGSLVDRTGTAPVRRTHDAGLRALVGLGSGGGFVLDLRAQGPHALVGGTTGAGKSEFLQAWVLGLAASHSPDRVTFLFVDYKGGAAFADCVDLPHTVGLVTDLSPHLVRRALTSLRAELRYREHLLNRKKAKDLLALERSGDPETPPTLVIVVDEFAALVQEFPEFVDGVVDVAQRGRSLGLHLILATQRPAGVIKDNLRANTNLRVALRMADEHDSVDVLGSEVAAGFDPSVPGRGAVRTGPGRIAMFQTGYAGGRSTSSRPRPTIGLESLAFGPGEVWDLPAPPELVAATDQEGPTDIARAVRTMRSAAAAFRLPEPRKPWLPELPSVVPLADLGPASDHALVLGVVDVPARQEQRILHYRPDVDGAMVVFGTSGSGKSAALRTIGVSAGMASLAAVTGTAHGSGPVQVYGLDFGSGGLSMLRDLPHVGSVIDGSDDERVQRLLRRLRDELEERAGRYAAANAGTITDYRALAGRPDEPRIIVLVDGLSAFREGYESEPGRARAWASFGRIVAEGRPLGVHVVMSAERPGALPTGLAGSVQRRLVLRQADENAYGVLDVPKDVLTPQSSAGRAVLAGDTDELQIAVPGGGVSPAEQAAEVGRLADSMRAAGVRSAPPVQRLPEYIDAAELPDTVGGLPVLGVADDTLEPVGFTPRGTFLLAGLPGSGRSTVLRSLASALRRYAPEGRLFYFGSRRSPLHAADFWTRVAVDPDDIAALARELLPEASVMPEDGRQLMVVVESIADLLSSPAEQPLTELVKAARRHDHLILAESETSQWASSWPLVAEIRNGRRGLVLQPDHHDGDALFRAAFPRMSRAEFPPGRGVYVESGRLIRIQVPATD